MIQQPIEKNRANLAGSWVDSALFFSQGNWRKRTIPTFCPSMPVTPIWAHLVGVCEPREGLLLWSVRVAFVFGVFACLRQYFKTFLNRRKRLPSKENPFRTPGWRSVLCIRRFNVDLFAVIVVVCADLHYTQCPMIYGCRFFLEERARTYWIMAPARRVQQRICSFFGGGGQPAKLLFRKLGQGFSDEIANESELCIVQLPVFFFAYISGGGRKTMNCTDLALIRTILSTRAKWNYNKRDFEGHQADRQTRRKGQRTRQLCYIIVDLGNT